MKLTSPSKVKKIMESYGLRTKKKLGQNFIVDENVLKKILKTASLEADDIVLEIGPGLGTLTEPLAKSVKSVVAIEIDKNMINILEDTITSKYNNINLIEGDALQINFEDLLSPDIKEVKVVANLPYYITTPLLVKLARTPFSLKKLVLTVQRDAAERFLAKKGQSEYSAITVILDYFFKKELVMKLPPAVFFPPPKVDSAVIKLEKRCVPPVGVKNESAFIDFIRKCFSQKRKTLKNNLNSFLAIDKQEIEKSLKKEGVDIKLRPQDLDMFGFARIFNMFYNEYDKCFR